MTSLILRTLRAIAFIVLVGSVAGAQDGPLRPGDRVLLRVLLDSVLVDTVRIDARGFAVLPIAGDVSLGGIAGGAVQDSIRATLSRFVAPGAVEATVLRRVRVIGEVTRPGVLYVDRTFTLRDAIALAGGPTESGSATEVVVERGGQRRMIKDWHSDATALEVVDSGDQLVVPRLPWWKRNAPYLVSGAATILATVLVVITR